MASQRLEAAYAHLSIFRYCIYIGEILNLESGLLGNQDHVLHLGQHPDLTGYAMSQQTFRFRETGTESDRSGTPLKVALHGLYLPFIPIGGLVGKDQFQIIILRLVDTAQLRPFIFQILLLVDLEISEHIRYVRQGGQ